MANEIEPEVPVTAYDQPPEDANVSPEPAEAEAQAPEKENEADSSPAAEETSDEQKSDEKARKKARSLQDSFDRLTEQREEAKRERDAWRELAMRDKPQEQPGQPAAPEAERTLADFSYDERAFAGYLSERSMERARQTVREELAQHDKNQQEQQRQAKHHAREQAFAKSHEDYLSVTRSPGLQISPVMASVIADSDVGPEVAYYLGQNPSEAARIAAIETPLSVAREMGRIERTLTLEKESQPTSAPSPAPRIAGREAGIATSTTSPASDKLSDAEWFRREEKRLAKKRG